MKTSLIIVIALLLGTMIAEATKTKHCIYLYQYDGEQTKVICK